LLDCTPSAGNGQYSEGAFGFGDSRRLEHKTTKEKGFKIKKGALTWEVTSAPLILRVGWGSYPENLLLHRKYITLGRFFSSVSQADKIEGTFC
jgi:hypothetical protein